MLLVKIIAVFVVVTSCTSIAVLVRFLLTLCLTIVAFYHATHYVSTVYAVIMCLSVASWEF